MEDFIPFKIFHGGTFEDHYPNLRYIGGNTITIKIELDKLSFFEIIDYVMETGSYTSKDFFVYCLNPTNQQEFKRLYNDQDVLDMAMKIPVSLNQCLELYIHQGPILRPCSKVPLVQPNVPMVQPNVPMVQPNLQLTQPNVPMVQPNLQLTQPIFRLFICFDGVKRGYINGCRKLLCLDGCFLKTFLGGMLLAAIGRDGNDQMYPVAWAVVEGENNDSWQWFMDQLRRCLDVQDGGEGWTLVSDQQKGLLNAVNWVWPKAEHRNCARHIYANWHKTFKGDELKEFFWKAVRSYHEADYNKAIEEIKTISNDAYEAFIKQNPKCFVRCFLDTTTKCDVVVNNMAETFNGYIIKSRSQHLIVMLEDIRVAIMTRLIKMNMDMSKKDFVVCPNIQKKLDREKSWAHHCTVFPSSYELFQVRGREDVTVDLQSRTCTCRKWDLTGIPCGHVCAVAGWMHKPAEEFVNECYTKDVYMKAYEYTIPPIPSEKFWPIIVCPLDPPPIKIQPGRPKKNRKRDPHEDPKHSGKLSKHGVLMHCSVCKERGHNKSRCTNGGGEPVAKKPRGRPKKVVSEAEVEVAGAGASGRGRGRGRGGGRRGGRTGGRTGGRGGGRNQV